MAWSRQGQPIVVEIPQLQDADRLIVSRNGTVLQSSNLNSSILIGLVDRIPDSAFVRPAISKRDPKTFLLVDYISEDRKILTSMVEEINKLMNGANQKTLVKRIELNFLFASLVDFIRLSTYRNYEVPSAYYLTQSQILDEIVSIRGKLYLHCR